MALLISNYSVKPTRLRRAAYLARYTIMRLSILPSHIFVVLGSALLVPVLFTARVVWGTHAGFSLLSFISKSNGLVALSLMSVCGALIAALPFGLLFGIAMPSHSTKQAVLVATIPALLLLAFSAWVNSDAAPSPHWFVRTLDLVLFVAFFASFATFSSRIGALRQETFRWWAAVAFTVLAFVYCLSPQVYYSYFYV